MCPGWMLPMIRTSFQTSPLLLATWPHRRKGWHDDRDDEHRDDDNGGLDRDDCDENVSCRFQCRSSQSKTLSIPPIPTTTTVAFLATQGVMMIDDDGGDADDDDDDLDDDDRDYCDICDAPTMTNAPPHPPSHPSSLWREARRSIPRRSAWSPTPWYDTIASSLFRCRRAAGADASRSE